VVWTPSLSKRIYYTPDFHRSWVIIFSTVTRLMPEQSSNLSNPYRDKRFFTSPKKPDYLWGLPSFLCSGFHATLSQDIKVPGHKVYHSFPSSTRVKKSGTVPSPFIILMTWYLIKYKHNFTYFTCSWYLLPC